MFKNIVYLESEVTMRDWYSRLLLACVLAKNGYVVVTGRKGRIHDLVKDAQGGIWFSNTFTDLRYESVIKYARNNLQYIFAFCDESPGIDNEYWYQSMRCGENAVKNVDMILASSDYHRDVLMQKFSQADFKDLLKVFPVGVPRFDLLDPTFYPLYESQVQKIKEDYENFVLVPLHGMEKTDSEIHDITIKSVRQGKIKSSDFVKRIGYYKDHRETHKCFIQDIFKLAKLVPATKFIIRHKNLFSGLHTEDHNSKSIPANIVFDSKYSIHPWILASDLMIHNNSVAGIESEISNVKTIFYNPNKKNKNAAVIPRKINKYIENFEELVSVFEEKTYDERQNRNKNYYVPNFNQMSYKKIESLVQQVEPQLIGKYKFSHLNPKKGKFKFLMHLLHHNIYSGIPKRNTGKGGPIRYMETREAFKLISEILFPNSTNDLTIRPIDNEVYVIQRNQMM